MEPYAPVGQIEVHDKPGAMDENRKKLNKLTTPIPKSKKLPSVKQQASHGLSNETTPKKRGSLAEPVKLRSATKGLDQKRAQKAGRLERLPLVQSETLLSVQQALKMYSSSLDEYDDLPSPRELSLEMRSSFATKRIYREKGIEL
ncbi:hypothetical protein GUITHDRAFT_151818 [Guillardia theta CCMP2712]|uniref:Uncharacterized protein n=1 Tax=Guillardia theta (strain CCMP2712) TaxID=905079 RepID=L1JJ68_GUITC|nr:hypothetical protein GUITHDRAFT_151818 [Guillardia theta CCMP2712]EKX48199.1 hypothetical protein GUITHDRAFT_151818 [Guillardia theta CCMP2712]|eukprot:XP_005835179.1 hypothetical protein GUITHDRAFT_151818 [Guillardia theta CCMP2712]